MLLLANRGRKGTQSAFHKVVHSFVNTLLPFMVTVGFGTLILISIMRSLAIRKPLLEIKKLWIVKVLIFWMIYAFVLSILQLFIYLNIHRPTEFVFWGLLVMADCTLILIVSILLCNIWSAKCLMALRHRSETQGEITIGCQNRTVHKRNVTPNYCFVFNVSSTIGQL